MSLTDQHLREKGSVQSRVASPVPISPPPSRPSSPLPQSLANRRPHSQYHGHGMRIAHGLPIPLHMRSPLEDGYRTPTGEDYEHHFRAFRLMGGQIDGATHLLPIHPGHFHYSQPQSARSRLSFATVTEKLDEKLAWRQRIRHFTWNFFSLNMATGGIASVIYNIPFRFAGLDTIGTIVFLFNLIFFLLCLILITMRFCLFPETFKASLLHPTESLFMPGAVVALGTIFLNIGQYGLYNVGPWLNEAVLVIFWLFVVLSILASSCTYLLMWSTQTFTIAQMTPVWIFPAYPLLVVGPFAGFLASSLDETKALDIIIGGFVCQGIGFLVSMMVYSAYIYRLMTQKLPRENLRPGMFVSVGPSAFTVAAIISMAANAERAFPSNFMGDGKLAAMVIKVVANFVSLWIWGLALWFFIVSVGAHWSCMGRGGLQFAMTWFSFVFPNTALILATFAIGRAFDSFVIQIIGCLMTCILIVVWMLVFTMMIRAIAMKHILWPQRQEDRDEGGFKAPEMRKASEGEQAEPV